MEAVRGNNSNTRYESISNVIESYINYMYSAEIFNNVALSPSVLYTIGDYLSVEKLYILFRGEAEDNIMCPRINHRQ